MQPTIVDVVENFFGELPTAGATSKMTEPEFSRLADEVNRFSLATAATTVAPGHFYGGGWTSGLYQGQVGLERLIRQLLYAPGLVVHDPLAEWFYPQRTSLEGLPGIRVKGGKGVLSGDPPALWLGDGHYAQNKTLDRERSAVGHALDFVRLLAPFLRSGEVVAVNQLELVRRHQAGILSAIRRDVRDAGIESLILDAEEQGEPVLRADHIRGLRVTPTSLDPRDERRSVVQEPMYYLYKTLAIAAHTGTTYLPPAPSDVRLFESLLGSAASDLRTRDVEVAVSFGLAETELPFLDGLDATALLSARQDEPAFEAWRATLRNGARLVASAASDSDDFIRDASEAIRDAVLPAADEVRRSVGRSGTLSAAARAHGIEFTAGAAGLGGAAAATGEPLTLAAVVALATTSTARWALQAIFGRDGRAENAFLASIFQRD